MIVAHEKYELSYLWFIDFLHEAALNVVNNKFQNKLVREGLL